MEKWTLLKEAKNSMKDIIKKALEGGYNFPPGSLEKESDDIIKDALTDKLFWESLGNVCGWGKYGLPEWKSVAFNFHTILLFEDEGWDKAVKYLLDLTR